MYLLALFAALMLSFSETGRNIAFCLFIPVVFFNAFQKDWHVQNIPRFFYLLLIFLGVVALSAAMSPYPEATRGLWDVARYVGFAALFYASANDEHRVRNIIMAMACSLILANLVGLYQYFHPAGRWIWAISEERRTLLTFLGDYNSTATFVAMAMPFFIAGLLSEPNKRLFYAVLVIAVGLSALILLLSYSRGPWGGVFAGTVVVLIVSRAVSKKLRRTALVFLLLGLLAFGPIIYQRMLPTFDLRHHSTSTRFVIWGKTLEMVKDHPVLGIGPRTFGLPENRETYSLPGEATHAHNMFLETAAELGLLGLLALLFWFGYLIIYLVRNRGPATSLYAGMRAGALGSIAAALITGLAHPIFGTERAILFMTIMGLTLGLKGRLEEKALFF